MTIDADILYISHRRPGYVHKSLPALLDSLPPGARLWIWQNGLDPATLEAVRQYKDHRAVHRYHESPENVRLYPPIQWVLTEGKGRFFSKVDDDCIMPPGWVETLCGHLSQDPALGVLGCWRFQDEDYIPELAEKKILKRPTCSVLQNLWVEGSGFMVDRRWIARIGGMKSGERLPSLFKRIGAAGAINGWIMPFVCQDHMDDPRSPNTGILDNEDIHRDLPLSWDFRGELTVESWTAQLRRSAAHVQRAPLDPKLYIGSMARLRAMFWHWRRNWRKTCFGLRKRFK